jgi:hypothetical protein
MLISFYVQAPVNYVCLHCVKPSLRPLSIAMSTVSIHIFGDVPSSPLVGLLQVLICYMNFYDFTGCMKLFITSYDQWLHETCACF